MFTLPEDKGQRIEQAIAQRICTAPDGSYIRRSSGRRRPGRPFKYTVHMVNGSSFVIRAGDDQAAVDTANLHATEQSTTADGATGSLPIENVVKEIASVGGVPAKYFGNIT